MRLGVAGALVGERIVPGDVEIRGDTIEAVGLSRRGRGLAVPGFVDLHVNGLAGVDFLACDELGLAEAARSLAATGVVAFLPTVVSAPLADLRRVLGLVRRMVPRTDPPGARPVGVHLEGPFLSPRRAGVHRPEYLLEPDAALLAELMEIGPVSQVTLAPELDGAMEVIRMLAGRGTVASLGHSDADAATAHRAFDAGARSVTHLFNAMRPVGHREAGLAGAALARDDVVLPVIVDGVHLSPEAVQLVWRAAPERMVLVTDAVAATGVGDGAWSVGPVEVRVEGAEVRDYEGRLAGSVLTMDQAVRHLVATGVPLVDAVRAASTTPGRLLGMATGGIGPGCLADLVVLDDRLEVATTLIRGVA